MADGAYSPPQEGDASAPPDQVDLQIPYAMREIFTPARVKVYWGGRGAGRSWGFGRALIGVMHTQQVKALCCREYQTNIKDSVHALLKDQIERLGLGPYFSVTRDSIKSLVTGAEAIFDGLHNNAEQIKSKEGIGICWVEEGRTVTEDSWRFLIPTVMRIDPPEGPFGQGSELWVSFNQGDEEDPTYKRFVTSPPPGSIVRAVTWKDNPFFPSQLDAERRYMAESDPDAYEWVWGTACRRIGSSVVMRGRYTVHNFEPPERVERWLLGVDWGFAADPVALIKSYIVDDELWVYDERFSWGLELDEHEQFFDSLPGTREWPIKADGARPETISFVRRKGFNISAADKWPGSVEDGIAHLKGFRKIHIHERNCPHIAREAALYSYKVDKTSGDVLPVIVDKHNHGWDAERYALDGYIQRRGGLGVWAKLAR